MLPASAHRLAGPGGGQDVEALVKHLPTASGVELLTGPAELAGAVSADADAESHPTDRQPIQRRDFARHLHGPPPRQRRDHRAEPQPLGGAGDGCQRDPRVGDRGNRCGVGDVVPHEEPIPAGGLGVDRQIRHRSWFGKRVEDRQEQGMLHARNAIGRPSVVAALAHR